VGRLTPSERKSGGGRCGECAGLLASGVRAGTGPGGTSAPGASTTGKRGEGDSAKIRMILQLLRKVEERSGGEEKTIVFSQFTTMLDLVQGVLKREGVRYVRCECFLLFFMLCYLLSIHPFGAGLCFFQGVPY
jgi:hypothetical protein